MLFYSLFRQKYLSFQPIFLRKPIADGCE
jgi:hypothetical protein